jgi:hypothetical protein
VLPLGEGLGGGDGDREMPGSRAGAGQGLWQQCWAPVSCIGDAAEKGRLRRSQGCGPHAACCQPGLACWVQHCCCPSRQHLRISGAAAGHLAAISALPRQPAQLLTNLLRGCCLQDDLHEIMRLRKQAAEYQLAYYPSYGACAGEFMSPSCHPARRSLV